MELRQFAVAYLVVINILTVLEMLYYGSWRSSGRVRFRWVFPATVLFYLAVNAGSFAELAGKDHVVYPAAIVLGTVALCARFVIKYIAARALGRFWKTNIEIQPGHRLVTDGPYRLLRHPGYLSTFFEMLTLPLVASAWYTGALVLLLYPLLLQVRISFEEKALLEQFGGEYERYQSKTRRIIPYVY